MTSSDDAARNALADARATLKRVWGYDEFRPGQEEILAAILAGRDALAVMPTGGGKSLCYQLPSLLRPGLTLVISPLIALMRDQVSALRALGVAAGALTSANEPAETAAVMAGLREGALRLLYCAPERLALPDTAEMLARAGLSLLAVDEAHCVAQWGHDFRPDYLGVGAFRQHLEQRGGRLQLAAFTATADEATRAEIVARLFSEAHPPRVFVRGFDRPNLRLAFEPKRGPRQRILEFVRAHRDQAGIVYCASRKGVEQTAEFLCGQGVRALPYHAGLDARVRNENQRVFVHEDGVVMTATVAFGMGVDKPDVRFVVHAELPKTVESYYQEIGRAGRDGLPADTLTLYGLDDMKLRRRQIDESDAPEERKRADRARLAALFALAEAPTCRRQTLLAYFGEKGAPPCGACDLCETKPERINGSVLAQKAMSAALRTGQRFGVEHLVAVLRGEETDAVKRFGHAKLPTFGVGADLSRNEWRAVFRQIYAAGLTDVNIAEFGQIGVTEAGWEALRGQREVWLRKDTQVAARDADSRTVRRAAAPVGDFGEPDAALLAALKKKRLELAKELSAPAYVVFSDRTLLEIAARKPASMAALAEVHGVGEAKLKKFGAIVLEIVEKGAT